MAKKRFSIPYVRLSGMNTGDGNVVGGGSGQSTTDPFPCDYDMYSILFEDDDSNGNGTPIEWEDYIAWWKANRFDPDYFEELNGEPLP